MRTAPKTLQKSYPARYDIDEDTLDPNSSLSFMLQMAGRRKDVLDVGCASGYLAKLMSVRDCNVVGVDVNAAAAAAARAHCTRVFVADLDFTSLATTVEGATFDVIVFGDILEHLREPRRILDESRALLRADGYVVASIPNIAHGAIRLALLEGRFDYSGMGVLDETHLRFFTLKTIEELLIGCGYDIRRIERTKVPLFNHPDGLIPNLSRTDYADELVAEVQRDPEHDTLQYIVQAFPLEGDARVRLLAERFIRANTERATAEDRAERLASQLAKRDEALDESKRRLLDASNEVLHAQESFRELAATEPGERTHRMELELVRAQERLEFASVRLDDLRERFVGETARQEQTLAELRERFTAEGAALQARLQERDASLEAAQKERLRLSAEVSELQTRVLERQSAVDRAFVERDRLVAEVSALQSRVLERQAAVEAAFEERDRIAKESQLEIENLKSRVLERQAAVEAALGERDRVATESQSAIKNLQAHVMERHAAVDRAIAERDRSLEQSASLEQDRGNLVRELDRVNSEFTAALKRQADLDEEIAVAREDLDGQTSISASLRQRLAERTTDLAIKSTQVEDLRARFLVQTDMLIDRTRRETQQISTLIDVVQSSRFWRLKGIIGRLRWRR